MSVNVIGFALLRSGRLAVAVEAFKLNAAEYPDSWNAHGSLGEGHAAVGDVRRAVASYERSLALNPRNANAARKLEELRRRAGVP